MVGTNLPPDARMTAPRNVRPGVTWFVTRRTTRRHHLFTPDEAGLVEQLYWYTTAVYANELGVQVHMTQLLSTHCHEVLTDTRGNLPRFFELRNRALANALKVLRGWPEEVVSKTPANWVELPTAEAMVKEMAYTAANCVAAGLVRTPRRWPGAKVLVDEVGRRVVKVMRPDFYFNPNNPKWPEEVTLRIVMPRILGEAFKNHEDARQAVQVQLDNLVRRAHRDRKTGLGYAGAKRILKMRHTRRASSREPFGSRNPTFAAAGNLDVARTLVDRRRAFLSAYRAAWRAWKAGDRSTIFPLGSWKMRAQHSDAHASHPRPAL